jgi:hypothetical protein
MMGNAKKGYFSHDNNPEKLNLEFSGILHRSVVEIDSNTSAIHSSLNRTPSGYYSY